MQQRYGKDGLVLVSVSIDDVEEKESPLKFLRSQKASFPNYLLNESVPTWQDRWDIKGPPAVLVYDRSGSLARKFDNNDPEKQFTLQDVEQLVQQLLPGDR